MNDPKTADQINSQVLDYGHLMDYALDLHIITGANGMCRCGEGGITCSQRLSAVSHELQSAIIGASMAKQIAKSALHREFVLGHQLSSDAKTNGQKMAHNSELEKLNSVALEIHAFVEYGNFEGARETLRLYDNTKRNIALRLLVEKWRNNAGTVSYLEEPESVFRQCAKELEEALSGL